MLNYLCLVIGGLGYDPQVKGYRKSSHTTYQLNYHFVFITKYRKPALRGDVAVRLRDLIREICARNQIEILKGHVRPEGQVLIFLSNLRTVPRARLSC